MKTLISKFWHGEEGQDLIEYTLLLGFVALGSAAVMTGAGSSTKGVWIKANTTLGTANTMAAS